MRDGERVEEERDEKGREEEAQLWERNQENQTGGKPYLSEKQLNFFVRRESEILFS